MGCNCCTQFPGTLYFLYQRKSSGQKDDTTTQAAWNTAVAAIPAFVDSDPWFQVNATQFEPNYLAITLSGGRKWLTGATAAHASANRVRYRWTFMPGSCYVKVWWEEFISAAVPTVTSGPTAKDWTWTSQTSTDGLCLPAGFIYYDQSTWPAGPISEAFTIEPPEPANVTMVGSENDLDAYVRKLRPSWVDGYEPPTDGSANGWPAA